LRPCFDEDEKLVGAVNCFQDLTVQKQAEQERTQLSEELHQAKKVEALGQLTAGVVHDFNNLLTAILDNLELLKDVTPDEGSRQLLRNATRSAQRGAELNAQLLGFARKQTLLLRAIDLNHVLTGMSDLLRATVGDLIRIETCTRPNTWPVLVDSNQIALVVLNLVINARDAMPCGGTLTIEMRYATFGIGDSPDGLPAGDYVTLSVSDTGAGMSEDVRAMAFEPFFTTKGPGEGSGLGLSMVLGVATQSGGGVQINSQPGSGTSIQVLLPRARIEAFSAEMEEEASPHHPVIRGEVVLVVDDDSDVREATAGILASLGYHSSRRLTVPQPYRFLQAANLSICCWLTLACRA
jgi:signal transduction histidine kinase